jgi:hypothetical protein
MLNDASIDIDEEPLGDYKNGHIGIDDVEDVEEEGGDDELEEVDADTYEDVASKKDHITRRTTNYTKVEDEALIRAWDSVTRAIGEQNFGNQSDVDGEEDSREQMRWELLREDEKMRR